MPRKRLLESWRPQDRAAQRQKLGTLRDLTVQPATRKRYSHATDEFLKFLTQEGTQLPKDKHKLDPLVCDYLEHLWASGAGRALACDTLAGLQDLQPGLHNHLPGAWRLLKAWHMNEIPNRAPPLPEHLLQAMVGWSIFHGHVTFGISLLLGFYTMLRTGELLGLRSSHMVASPEQQQVLISLGLTKGGKRQGAAESVVLGHEPAVLLVKQWKTLTVASTPLARSPGSWRGLFTECLEALDLGQFGFRPYSLRRGGATFWFSKHQSLDRILVQGRWQAQKTARIYINEGLAILAGMKFRANDSNIRPFVNVFLQTVKYPQFRTLEPSTKVERSGGRGRKSKQSTKRASKCACFHRFSVDVGNILLNLWSLRMPGGLARQIRWKDWSSSCCLGFGPAFGKGFLRKQVSKYSPVVFFLGFWFVFYWETCCEVKQVKQRRACCIFIYIYILYTYINHIY